MEKIDNVCELVREPFTPSDDDIRKYVGLEHIEQGTLKLCGIGSSSCVKSNKLQFRSGQILFGKLRPYFRKVIRPDFDGVCSTDILVIDSKKGYDNGYLFYFFANNEMIEEATRSSEGTRMPRASWKYLSQLKKPFPSLPEQRAIAEILSSLDDKIKLNRRMNATLEHIAQAIFKRWFIDFEFPDENGQPYKSSGGEMVESELGEIPRGWEVKAIGDICKTSGGGTPKTKEPSYWEDGDIFWATPTDMTSLKSPIIFDTSRKITEEGLNKSSAKLLPIGSVLMTSRATLGYFAITKVPICTNQGFISMVCDGEVSNYYLLHTLKNKVDLIENLASGSTYLEINKSSFRSISIIKPPSSLIEKFDNFVKLIYDKIYLYELESQNLSLIRDELLPKLMSGKIRISGEL
ncbi:restriction endonuclease subunit S [Methanohalophilus sp. WG1-DM]|uniref:restriction endonuclease subunit S n=1 Tax=Methanohalophilus sp. WG1-DM TaxID=2491675 RepID=UPI0013E8C1EA|nr:restriction endonuclease subunit S [Methanohalophilus sp. WG1-DM]